MFRHLHTGQYPERREGATGYLYAAMAEWLKAPGCNPGEPTGSIGGSTPSRRTLTATRLAPAAALMAAVVAILLP
jgi:hypothetical protein